MLELADDFAADWFLDLWGQAPTPAKAARLRETTIERFLKAHRIRRLQAAEVLRILKQKPLSVAPGVVEAATAHIRTVTARIRLVNQQLGAAHRKLDEFCDQLIPLGENVPGQGCEQRDVVILRSMPGLGRINLAVLLAEAWQPLGRRDYHALRCLSGVAPVTRRSGKTCIVVRRYACNKRLENALYHWARVAIQHDEPSRNRYAALRRRGHSHGRALRTVADRLLSVACTLLEQQTPFDPDYKAREAVAA
jgi:transposase